MRPPIHSPTKALLLAAVLVAAGYGDARAENRADDSESRWIARLHNTRAEAHYRNKRYRSAVEEFRLAHQSAALPVFVFNIAQAHRLGGDADQAVASYERFIELAPEHELVAEARDHIASLQGQLEREPLLAPTASPAADEMIEAELATSAALAVSESDVAPGRRAGGYRKLAGVSLAVVGLAGLGVSGGFAFHGSNLNAQAAGTERGTPEATDLRARGDTANLVSYIAGGTGGALLLTGGVLYYLGHRADNNQRRTLAIVPSIGPESAKVTFEVAF